MKKKRNREQKQNKEEMKRKESNRRYRNCHYNAVCLIERVKVSKKKSTKYLGFKKNAEKFQKNVSFFLKPKYVFESLIFF